MNILCVVLNIYALYDFESTNPIGILAINTGFFFSVTIEPENGKIIFSPETERETERERERMGEDSADEA
jgi:hypothetical protein